MRKRVPLLIVTACSALSLVAVLFVVNTDQNDELVLDQLNPFGSVEDVTLPMQVCLIVAAPLTWLQCPPCQIYTN